MRRFGTQVVAAACLVVSSSPPVRAADDGNAIWRGLSEYSQYALEVGAELFRWQEFDDGGKRLLTEQGPRFSLAASANNLVRREPGLIYLSTVRIYGGQVQYDGQDDSHAYVSSDTRYGGWNAELGMGYRVMGEQDVYAVDVYAAAGTERWRRNVLNSQNATGIATSGSAEDYAVDYGRAGLGFAHKVYDSDGYLNFGVRIPLSVREDTSINSHSVHLNPRPRGSPFISYKLSLRPTTRDQPFGAFVKLYYDGYRFGKSKVKSIPTLLVWQPESSMDAVGLTLGVSF
jgi:hypothetical protein